ncbi:glycosyltransferase family 2 protein [soil metagenome]
MKSQPRVYVLLLNWNGWRDSIECLESVFRQNYADYRVLVCDNDSGDDSVARIRAWAAGELAVAPQPAPGGSAAAAPIPKPIPFVEYDRDQVDDVGESPDPNVPLILINTGENLGFADGNNVGLRYALAQGDAEYVWLLNNDTVVDAEALTRKIELADSDVRIGMVGAKICYYDEPGTIQAIGGGNVTRWKGMAPLLGCGCADDGGWTEPVEVDCILGASLLVRATTVRDIGLLDERYFMYAEEMDWCERARRRGWRLLYSPGSKVWHKDGRSTGRRSPAQDYYSVRSTLTFVKKFNPHLLPFTALYTFYRCLLPKIVRRQPARLRAVLQAYADFARKRPARRPAALGNARGG